MVDLNDLKWLCAKYDPHPISIKFVFYDDNDFLAPLALECVNTNNVLLNTINFVQGTETGRIM